MATREKAPEATLETQKIEAPVGDSTALGPAAGEDTPPNLLRFYDRLRESVLSFVQRKGGKLGSGAAHALLLVPDIFMLLVRMSFDKEVPAPTRKLLGGALLYFVLPFDLLPEGLLGPGGMIDDLVLAAAVLTRALGPELESIAERHWSGPDRLRTVLGDITRSGRALLGDKLYTRLQSLLLKRGVPLS